MTIELLNVDCMEYMAEQLDGAFDLAIVDPPYGIGYSKRKCRTTASFTQYTPKKWDNSVPSQEYFNELMRVSANQIIWGGNYFKLPPSRCFVVWDKCQPEGVDQAMCEQAWLSFDKSAKIYKTSVQQLTQIRIHPTQKPVKLYDWLLTNYAKPGQRILDTHLGSGSSAIAAHYFGCDFVGCELDEEYYTATKARFNDATRQSSLFCTNESMAEQIPAEQGSMRLSV